MEAERLKYSIFLRHEINYYSHAPLKQKKWNQKVGFLNSENEFILADGHTHSKNLFAKSSAAPSRPRFYVIMILEKGQVRTKMMVASNSALADELNELAVLIGKGLKSGNSQFSVQTNTTISLAEEIGLTFLSLFSSVLCSVLSVFHMDFYLRESFSNRGTTSKVSKVLPAVQSGVMQTGKFWFLAFQHYSAVSGKRLDTAGCVPRPYSSKSDLGICRTGTENWKWGLDCEDQVFDHIWSSD